MVSTSNGGQAANYTLMKNIRRKVLVMNSNLFFYLVVFGNLWTPRNCNVVWGSSLACPSQETTRCHIAFLYIFFSCYKLFNTKFLVFALNFYLSIVPTRKSQVYVHPGIFLLDFADLSLIQCEVQALLTRSRDHQTSHCISVYWSFATLPTAASTSF